MDDRISLSAELASSWAAILEPYLGMPLLGVVDGIGVVEFVFDGEGGNLLTLWFDTEEGEVTYSHGFVACPREYARANREPLPHD